MAAKKPKVGDPAIMYGRSFVVVSVGKRSGVDVVTLHDEARQAMEAADRSEAIKMPGGTKCYAKVAQLEWMDGLSAWTVPGQTMDNKGPQPQ